MISTTGARNFTLGGTQTCIGLDFRLINFCIGWAVFTSGGYKVYIRCDFFTLCGNNIYIGCQLYAEARSNHIFEIWRISSDWPHTHNHHIIHTIISPCFGHPLQENKRPQKLLLQQQKLHLQQHRLLPFKICLHSHHLVYAVGNVTRVQFSWTREASKSI